ncbi:alpha/beta hydrolase family protein [Engelhardtia mirabilis]|uniref:Alpha/beta hydrolase family protein n=1 Tax=Engelhardtia mirabilis TaxID=2528011 RepID=A0A518BEF4_9BACT|nr:Alpha/beta hydrolase family protein [Planctomycetes bacterium Pla133]QDU99694.1 Alpha/beta hydrolase family protein [Planctomycetes bacterium Pla86]
MTLPIVLASRLLCVATAIGIAVQEAPRAVERLTDARRGFESVLVDQRRIDEPLVAPPEDSWSLVEYDAPKGRNAAYLFRGEPSPEPGPAVIWLTGGFPPARGGGYVWSPGPPMNDQSASPYREAGITMLFPTVRGTARNPGLQEGLMGEVDDVLAAARFLCELDGVDPARVYLGGHSTGATLALLVAESTDLFRGVFCFGPVVELADYGERDWPFDQADPREFRLRSPLHFLDAITSPTWVFEGEDGNSEDLAKLSAALANPRVRTLELARADHFSALTPVNRLLAERIRDHRESEFDLDLARVTAAYADFWHAQREARDLERLAELRRAGARWGEPHSLRFEVRSSFPERLAALTEGLAPLGFSAGPARQRAEGEDGPRLRMTLELNAPLEIHAVLDASRAVAEAAAELNVLEEGWTAAPAVR